MKFTLNWLKEHLDTTASIIEIANTLTRLGLEVEEVIDPASDLQDFFVAEIISTEPHPNADRLRVCLVNVYSNDLVQVVCGAPNARAGLKTVFAPPGAVIPATGQILKVGQIRGVESHGMLCSAKELGLGGDSEGILELPETATPGLPVMDTLGWEYPIIEIAVTPNRGDCLSMRGIARDLAAAGVGVLKEGVGYRVSGMGDTLPTTDIVLAHTPHPTPHTPAFALQPITGVSNRPSPLWLQDCLTAVGLKSISALVDVTNYITHDIGRPLHVYDADKLRGPLRLKLSEGGETFAALNGETYTLPAGLLMICDDSGVVSLAGVIGGAGTSCDLTTRNVLVESALFDSVLVATAGRAVGIYTEARARFERGVDPALVLPGLARAVAMMQEFCGGTAGPVAFSGEIPSGRRTLSFDPALVRTLGGVDLPKADCLAILERLGCETSVASDSPQAVITTPSWRPDLHGPADLVEEILRVHGYGHIPITLLPHRVDRISGGALPPLVSRARQVKSVLASAGWAEAVSWSFTDPVLAERFGGGAEALRLRNPISSELAAMRPSALPNLLLAARENIAKSVGGHSLFEVGPVFRGLQPTEQETVAAGVRWGMTPRHWVEAARPWDVFDAKAAALAVLAACGLAEASVQTQADAPAWYHPGRSFRLRLGKTVVAEGGELHPRLLQDLDLPRPVVAFEVFLDRLPLPRGKSAARPPFRPSAFQPVVRDFAFLINATTPAEEVLRAVRSADKTLIEDVMVFDSYQGKGVPEGKRSLALAVRLAPQERTLTETDLAEVSGRIVAAVAAKVGGELRG